MCKICTQYVHNMYKNMQNIKNVISKSVVSTESMYIYKGINVQNVQKNVYKVNVYRVIFWYCTRFIRKSAVFSKCMYVEIYKSTKMYSNSALQHFICKSPDTLLYCDTIELCPVGHKSHTSLINNTLFLFFFTYAEMLKCQVFIGGMTSGAVLKVFIITGVE